MEEILIRGVIFRITEESLGTWLAMAFSAILFGLLHMLNPGATWVAALCIAVEAGSAAGGGFHHDPSTLVADRAPFCLEFHPGRNLRRRRFGPGGTRASRVDLERAGIAFRREVRGGGVDFRRHHLHVDGDRFDRSRRSQWADHAAVLVEERGTPSTASIQAHDRQDHFSTRSAEKWAIIAATRPRRQKSQPKTMPGKPLPEEREGHDRRGQPEENGGLRQMRSLRRVTRRAGSPSRKPAKAAAFD